MKKTFCALLALLLTLTVLLSGCATRGETLLKAGGEEISVDVFQLYLSRFKGSLATAGYDVDSESFWKTYIGTDNTTTSEYYTKQVFEGLRHIAAAMIIYDELGLSLDKDTEQSIEDWIDALIEEMGEGSKSHLNSILFPYGANVTTLRDAALIEAKLSALKVYLYGEGGSLIGDTAIESYYQQTYYRGYQMQLANYYYDREKDDDGLTVFYTDEEFKHIAYDTDGEGVTKSGTKDKFGDDVYVRTVDEKEVVAYATEKGFPKYKYDSNGEMIVKQYTEAEMALRLERAEEIAEQCIDNEALFLQCMKDYSDNSRFNETYAPNGMYFSVGSYTTDAIFTTFSNELAKLEIGQLAVLNSDSGYYILMRAELDKGAWQNEANSRWFSTLRGLTLEYMLQQRTAEYLDRVEVNEELLATVNITMVGKNFYY